MKRVEVVVVGAGPAGLSAAVAAAEAGAEVLVIDEYPQPGGQIYCQTPETFLSKFDERSYDFVHGKKLLQQVRSLPITFMTETTVWGIFDGRLLAVISKNKKKELWAETLILATGAYERPVPFPGWTLPGVMTAGGVQRMLKTQWVLPGKTFLLVGTGPLQLVLANQLVAAGAKVLGIADASSWHHSWRYLPMMLNESRMFIQGIGYLWGIRKARIPLLKSHAIIRVEGGNQVERAVTADVDDNWHPIPNTERTWDVDTVCVNYGFISLVELAALAGCRLRYEPKWGSWVPECDQNMKTTVSHVYVAGDGAGLGGAFVAAHEGRIAGVNAAMELGYYTNYRTHPAQPSYQRLKRLRRFRTALDALWQFKDGLYDVIREDTIICRCEEIRYSDIKEAIAAGAEHVNQIKAWTRSGMGFCQGHFCEVTIAHLLAAATGRKLEKYTVRPPVKPLPVEALTDKDDVA